MAAAATKATLTWKDRLGKIARVAVYILSTITNPNDAVVNAVRTVLAAISKALNPEASLAITTSFTGTAGTGSYSNIEDRVLMRFKDANGKPHTFRIPCPKSTIFTSDKETVDVANSAVIAWKNAVIANCLTKAGVAITTFLGGRRSRKKAQKK